MRIRSSIGTQAADQVVDWNAGCGSGRRLGRRLRIRSSTGTQPADQVVDWDTDCGAGRRLGRRLRTRESRTHFVSQIGMSGGSRYSGQSRGSMSFMTRCVGGSARIGLRALSGEARPSVCLVYPRSMDLAGRPEATHSLLRIGRLNGGQLPRS